MKTNVIKSSPTTGRRNASLNLRPVPGVISVPSTYKLEIAQFERQANGLLKQPKEFKIYFQKNIFNWS